MTKPTIAVDLDGVLAEYEGWAGVDSFGDALPGAREFLDSLRELGRVVIHTTRTSPDSNQGFRRDSLAARVRRWLEANDLAFDEIWTGRGKPIASAYVDDRAVSCRPQEGAAKGAYAGALKAVRALVAESQDNGDAEKEED